MRVIAYGAAGALSYEAVRLAASTAVTCTKWGAKNILLNQIASSSYEVRILSSIVLACAAIFTTIYSKNHAPKPPEGVSRRAQLLKPPRPPSGFHPDSPIK